MFPGGGPLLLGGPFVLQTGGHQAGTTIWGAPVTRLWGNCISPQNGAKPVAPRLVPGQVARDSGAGHPNTPSTRLWGRAVMHFSFFSRRGRPPASPAAKANRWRPAPTAVWPHFQRFFAIFYNFCSRLHFLQKIAHSSPPKFSQKSQILSQQICRWLRTNFQTTVPAERSPKNRFSARFEPCTKSYGRFKFGPRVFL